MHSTNGQQDSKSELGIAIKKLKCRSAWRMEVRRLLHPLVAHQSPHSSVSLLFLIITVFLISHSGGFHVADGDSLGLACSIPLGATGLEPFFRSHCQAKIMEHSVSGLNSDFNDSL